MRQLYHRLCRHASFRVRFGDGTLSHRMTHAQARDYRAKGEAIVFDPALPADYLIPTVRILLCFFFLCLVGLFAFLIYLGAKK